MQDNFPFTVNDITAWIVRKKDGTTVRYNIVDAEKMSLRKTEAKSGGSHHVSSWSGVARKHYSTWCDHAPTPDQPPVFSNGRINLYIADAPGARSKHQLFDVCVDGGGVLTVPGEFDLPNAYGDPKLVGALSKHVYRLEGPSKTSGPKILKLRWNDRCAPPVYPSFWPALMKELDKLQQQKGAPLNVLTICQGGHGRSGSALVALMMCMTDYSPLDALTHIRALHCVRAIESKEQHQYLNLLAKELGREENALEAENVSSFKDRLLKEDLFEETYKERVRAGKGALKDDREAGYL